MPSLALASLAAWTLSVPTPDPLDVLSPHAWSADAAAEPAGISLQATADPSAPLDEQSAAVQVLRRLQGTTLGKDVDLANGTIQEAFCALANVSAALSDPPSGNFLSGLDDAPVSQDDVDLITKYAESLGCAAVAPPSPMPPPGPGAPPVPTPPSWPSTWPHFKLEAFDSNSCSEEEGYERIGSAAECQAAASSFGEYQELYTPMTQMPAGCFRQNAEADEEPFVYFNADPVGGPHADCAPICVLPGEIEQPGSSAGAGAGAGGPSPMGNSSTDSSMNASTNSSTNSTTDTTVNTTSSNASMSPNAPPPFVVSIVSPPPSPPAGAVDDAATVMAHCTAGSLNTMGSGADCYEYNMTQYNDSNFDCDVLDRVYADFGSFCATWVSNNFTYNGGTGMCDPAMASRVIRVDCVDDVRTETISVPPTPSVPVPSPKASPEASPEATPEANMMYFCNDGASAAATCYEYASDDYPDGNWACNTTSNITSFDAWCTSWAANDGQFNGGAGVCDTTSEIIKSECINGFLSSTIVQFAPPPSSSSSSAAAAAASPPAPAASARSLHSNFTHGLVMSGAWCADVAQPEMAAAGTPAECAQHCRRTTGCKFFVFAEAEGSCWQSDTGDDAGCPTSWVLDDRWDFYEVGITYSLVRDLGYCGGFGEMLAMPKTADAATCADHCAAREEGCAFFVVAPEDESCLVSAATSADCAKDDDAWVADDRWAFYEMLAPPANGTAASGTRRRVRR